MLRNSQQFIQKQPSFLAKLVMRYLKSGSFWGNAAKTPIKIRLDNLSIPSQDAFDLIENYFSHFAKKSI